MITRIHAMWLVLALICGSAFANDGSTNVRWAPDLVSAREAATKFKVPLLVHFYGDNCAPCRSFEQRVLTQAEVIGTLNKYFICVAINATQQPEVASEFNVQSWPTDVFLSADNQLLHRMVSPQDAREYMGVLTNVAMMNRERNNLIAPQSSLPPANEVASKFTPANSNLPSPTNPIQTPLQMQMAPSPAVPLNSNLPQPPASSNLAGANSETIFGQQRFGAQENAFAVSATKSNLPPLGAPNNSQIATRVSPLDNVPSILDASASIGSGQIQPNLPSRQVQVAQQRLTAAPAVASNSVPVQPSLAAPTGLVAQSASPQWAMQQPAFQQPALQQPLGATPDVQLPEGLARQAGASPQAEPALQVGPATRAVPGQLVSASQADSNRYLLTSNVAPSLTADVGPKSLTIAVVDPEKPILDGYCPVALRKQQWVSGSQSYAVQHRGKVYWMSSQDAAEAFVKSPDDYAPVLSGYDPMILLNEGRLVPGSTQYGLFETQTGKTMLFSSQQAKDGFQQSFEKNMQALNAVRGRAAAQ